MSERTVHLASSGVERAPCVRRAHPPAPRPLGVQAEVRGLGARLRLVARQADGVLRGSLGRFGRSSSSVIGRYPLYLLIGIVLYTFLVDAVSVLSRRSSRAARCFDASPSPLVIPLWTLAAAITFGVNCVVVGDLPCRSGVPRSRSGWRSSRSLLELYVFIVALCADRGDPFRPVPRRRPTLGVGRAASASLPPVMYPVDDPPGLGAARSHCSTRSSRSCRTRGPILIGGTPRSDHARTSASPPPLPDPDRSRDCRCVGVGSSAVSRPARGASCERAHRQSRVGGVSKSFGIPHERRTTLKETSCIRCENDIRAQRRVQRVSSRSSRASSSASSARTAAARAHCSRCSPASTAGLGTVADQRPALASSNSASASTRSSTPRQHPRSTERCSASRRSESRSGSTRFSNSRSSSVRRPEAEELLSGMLRATRLLDRDPGAVRHPPPRRGARRRRRRLSGEVLRDVRATSGGAQDYRLRRPRPRFGRGLVRPGAPPLAAGRSWPSASPTR